MFEKFKSSQISKSRQGMIIGGSKDGGNDVFKGTCPEVCRDSDSYKDTKPFSVALPSYCHCTSGGENEELQN